MAHIRAMQEASEKGKLQINVTSNVDGRPIADASISISYTGVPENMLERVETDSSGQTEVLELDAPLGYPGRRLGQAKADGQRDGAGGLGLPQDGVFLGSGRSGGGQPGRAGACGHSQTEQAGDNAAGMDQDSQPSSLFLGFESPYPEKRFWNGVWRTWGQSTNRIIS